MLMFFGLFLFVGSQQKSLLPDTPFVYYSIMGWLVVLGIIGFITLTRTFSLEGVNKKLNDKAWYEALVYDLLEQADKESPEVKQRLFESYIRFLHTHGDSHRLHLLNVPKGTAHSVHLICEELIKRQRQELAGLIQTEANLSGQMPGSSNEKLKLAQLLHTKVDGAFIEQSGSDLTRLEAISQLLTLANPPEKTDSSAYPEPRSPAATAGPGWL